MLKLCLPFVSCYLGMFVSTHTQTHIHKNVATASASRTEAKEEEAGASDGPV